MCALRKGWHFVRRLWYEAPAGEWEEALPLGNGRMGAMVYGGIGRERIQVNEESIWQGTRKNRENRDSRKYLSRIRELLFSGQTEEAEQLMKWALSGCPESMPSYQTLGDILFQFYKPSVSGLSQPVLEKAEDYHRELDLEKALCSVHYRMDRTLFHREIFFSCPADAMIMRFTASEDRALNFTVSLDRCKNAYDGIRKLGQDGLCLYGNLGRGGFGYAMCIRARAAGGSIQTIGEYLIVRDAREAVLVFSADCTWHYTKEEKDRAWKAYTDKTDPEDELFFDNLCEAELSERRFGHCMQDMLQEGLIKRLDTLLVQEYTKLLAEHEEEYRRLFSRVRLTLEGADEYDRLPTDQRLELTGKGQEAGLAPLYLDYGRYLLISCSRPGNLPANLQGIWNQELRPAWGSKYTININTEMNYWLAESGNLPECHLPLFVHLKRMLPCGRQAAKRLYGCRGFVAHHNTDIFGDCFVQDYWNPGSFWVMGAAWLCTHQWTHYLYTQDKAFLRDAFPVMREAAEFFLDYLTEHDGHLVTCPSVSPENTFILPNGHSGANTYGVTMDNQILWDLFEQCNRAAQVLGIADELDERIRRAKARLYPMQIAEDGYLMEWPVDYEELDRGHRHISHLYGLHPSGQITVDGTPHLARAARRTLERRLSNGGGHTGWSRAWIINHYARLWDGEKAYENLIQLLSRSTYPNLFDRHPPFQIDGNFGGAAAIIEMLVQSSEERTVLLPALPETWRSGQISGVRLVGGVSVFMEWKDGELVRAELEADSQRQFPVLYRGRQCLVRTAPGEKSVLLPEDFVLSGNEPSGA